MKAENSSLEKDFFLSHAKDLSYLELKEGAPAVRGVDLRGVPLPVRTSEFLPHLQKASTVETLDLEPVLRGMVYNVGIDPDFPYAASYRRILHELLPAPAEYAMSMAGEDLQKAMEDPEAEEARTFALIALRAATLLVPGDAFARTQYANFLWRLVPTEMASDFLPLSIQRLEERLREEETDALAAFSLGEIFANMGQYVKANSYYRMALANSTEEGTLEAIRQAMERIASDVAVENATYFLRRADYSRAIEALMEARAISHRYDTEYYLGVCYENIARYEEAIAAFQTARKRGADFPELYNDLTFCLNAAGRPEEALAVASEGLEAFPADLRLRYNRAVLFAEAGRRAAAVEDCNFILEYADLSNELFNEVMRLKEALEGEGPPVRTE